MTKTANVYIDGFNLYYGSLRGTPYKWLNLLLMCQMLLPNRYIGRIRFFTARITSQPHNPLAPERQGIYLRAIQTIPNLSIHLGRFSSTPTRSPVFPLVYLYPNGPAQTVRILKTEEKRSDVNLATLLLVDCVDDDFDEAVVISNDSDLMLPIEYAAGRFGKTVGVINPHRRSRVSGELVRAASWSFKEINRSILAVSQFPNSIVDAYGTITKPSTW